MKKTRIRIINGNEVKEYPESQRQKLIRFYSQGAAECDGSESDRYAYIADSLSMGAIEVNSYKEESIFPEGSEGALFEERMNKMLGLLFD